MKWIALIVVLTAVALVGYYPVRKAYWDRQVTDMCQKDGGLKVFEVADISPQEYEHFRVTPSLYGIRPAEHSGVAPVIRRTVQTVIREWNPQVMRSEQSAIRRSDGKVLAIHVDYWRGGGDIPIPFLLDSESGFICPGGPALRIEDVIRVKG